MLDVDMVTQHPEEDRFHPQGHWRMLVPLWVVTGSEIRCPERTQAGSQVTRQDSVNETVQEGAFGDQAR